MFLLALEPAKLEVFMSARGFVKIVEICLLKLQENVKNKQQQQEAHRVSKDVPFHLFFLQVPTSISLAGVGCIKFIH